VLHAHQNTYLTYGTNSHKTIAMPRSGRAPFQVALKSLTDPTMARPVVENYVLPWSEIETPPFGAMNCIISPGGASNADKHNQDEIIFVYRGIGEVDVTGELLEIQAGDVVYIPKNLQHTIQNKDDGAQLAFFSVWWPRVEPS
jgi:quercetin dioxygenase-like cupin family protein